MAVFVAIVLIALVGSCPQALSQACTGLCLQQVSCPGSGTTSITGTVYAPNGTTPLPNVLVYIPNGGPAPTYGVQPFPSGVGCEQSGEPVTGSPMVQATTATNGTFKLVNVPVGTNIPLVIQAGRWRRQVVIPAVSACTNTTAPAILTSLPSTQAQGDIPQIAVVTGLSDATECLLQRIGIANSEFTIPSGPGRVHLFFGNGETLPGIPAESTLFAKSSPATTPTNSALDGYDMVMFGCYGTPAGQSGGDTNAVAANQELLRTYADAGGRVVANHYGFAWIDSPNVPDFTGTASWDVEQNSPIDPLTVYVDQTFPKGQQLAAWLKDIDPSSTLGQFSVGMPRWDFNAVNAAEAQEWLYWNNSSPSLGTPIQYTFNTPVNTTGLNQCGRVLFYDYHVEANSSQQFTGTFPSACATTALTPQEQLALFGLFDLTTPVSPDTAPTASLSFVNAPAAFIQGDPNDAISINITNTSTTTPTNPSLSVTLVLPPSLTVNNLVGTDANTGWICTTSPLACTRATGLSANTSDPLTLTVSVSSNPIYLGSTSVEATVSGGGLATNVTGDDSILINPPPTVTVNVGTSPGGLGFSIDGNSFSATQTPTWTTGSPHTLTTTTPQYSPGAQYNFLQWTDGTVSTTDSATATLGVTNYFASFSTSYLLNVTAGTGGTVTAASGSYFLAGTPQPISATPSAGYYFTGWTGSADVASPLSPTTSVTVNQPENITANFLPIPSLVVTTLSDDSPGNAADCPGPSCTLRDAITAADANNGGAGAITFQSGLTGTIDLTSASAGPLPALNGLITIAGPGANVITVSGANSTTVGSIFNVSSGAAVGISGLTIANANTGSNGGGITSQGTLTVSSVTLSNDTASSAAGLGGGIYNNGGTLTVSDSTFATDSTTGQSGGGIYNASGTLIVNYSTFSGNISAADGGAIATLGPAAVNNSTFSSNQSAADGGAIANDGSSTVTVANSIFSGNSAASGAGLFNVSGGSAVLNANTNAFYNNLDTVGSVEDDCLNCATNANPVFGNPNLAPLGNYGGSTQTLLPVPSSPAICAASSTLIPSGYSLDQRGLPNSTTYGSTTCYDLGAVETNYAINFTAQQPSNVVATATMAPAPIVTVTESSAPLTAGSASVSVTDAATDLIGSPATSITASGLATFGSLSFTTPTTGDTLTATLALNPTLNTTAVSTPFNVSQITPLLSFSPSPGSQIYGTAIASGSLDATATANSATVAGTFAYTTTIGGILNQPVIAGVTVLPAATYTITATFTPASPTLYASGLSTTATYTVNQALLSVTAGSYSGVYDGATHALSACTVGANPDGLTCTNSPTGPVGPDVGSATVTPVLSASTANYNVTTINGSWSITPRTVNLTAGSYTGVYDGNPHSPSPACASNYAGVTCTNNPGSVGPGVGSGAVAPTPAYATGVAGDYIIVPQNGAYSISQAPLTVTAGSYSGVYSGSTQALSACTVSANPDGLTCTNNPTGPVGPDVGSGTVTPVLSGSIANYNVKTNNGAWSITALPVTVTGGSYSAVYDGNVHSPSTCASSYAGVTCTNSPASVGPDVGGAAVVPIATVVTGVAADYAIAPINGSWSIAARTVSITAGSYTGVYNGSAHSPSACGSNYAGVTCTNSPNSVGAGVGSGAIIPTPAYATGVAGDYIIVPQNGSYSISQAPLTLTAGSYSGVYNGSSQVLSACAVSSNFDGLTCTNSPAGPVGPNTGSGTVTPVLSGSAANYNVTTNNGSWSITTLPVTITGGSYSGVYDGNVHSASACVSSFAGVSCTNTPASVGANVGSGTVAPTAAIASGVAADYAITPTSGTWSITARAVTVTAGSYTGAYDGNVHLPSACVSSYSGVTCTNSPSSVGPSVGSGTVVPVTALATGIAADYSIAAANGSYTIGKANQTITLTGVPASATYGQGPFTLSYSASSTLPVTVVAAGNCSLSGTTLTITASGSCTVTASQAGNGNFNAAPTLAPNFTVGKEPQTITFAKLTTPVVFPLSSIKLSATGGGSGNPVTFTVTGPATLSGTTLTITGPGSVTVTANQAGNGNYLAATPVSQTIQVNQPPCITSAASTTFEVGVAGSFQVKATGTPTPTFSESGTLPSGVTFNTTTGVLSGTPAAGTGGTYSITITAANGVGSNAVQKFTLYVEDFTIAASPSSVTILPGQKGVYAITLTSLGNLTGNVALGCSGNPAGSTCMFSSNPAKLSGTSSMTVDLTSCKVTNGTYTLTVTGTLGSLTHSAKVTLIIK